MKLPKEIFKAFSHSHTHTHTQTDAYIHTYSMILLNQHINLVVTTLSPSAVQSEIGHP